MTGTEKSDRSGGPSCEARTDRYVILNKGQIACEDGDGNDVFTAAQADAVVTRANEILGYDLGRTERLSAYQKLRERALLRSVESTGSVREDDEEAMPPSFYDSQLRALLVFETREEKLERLVEVVLTQGQLHASWLAAELLASRSATLTPEQIKRFEGAADRGLSANHEKNLLTLLTNVTVAADRLIQQWAESDDDVKHALWKSLGSAVQAAEETVYPLPSEAGQ